MQKHYLTILAIAFALLLWVPGTAVSQDATSEDDSLYTVENYTKQEFRIPMRDGITLFTAIYSPKDTSRKYPVLLNRTPYAVSPYGTEKSQYKKTLGPSGLFLREGYIFVYQDVRGRFMSEGEFVNVTPHLEKKRGKKDTDESTDTYDTIEWLLAHLKNDNGKVGQWGISYPGFYTSAGMINGHPALVAASPQAPIADWFWDDFFHHGAFFLPHAFNFFSIFGQPRHGLTKTWPPRFDHGTPDGYAFFKALGPLKNASTKYFGDSIAFWNKMMQHPNYDEFWKQRNILPHLNNIDAAVMTVGGWFDAEDLYGPLKTYATVEESNPGTYNILVMGPWRHGGWARDDGASLGNVGFGAKTSLYYQENIEFPFFQYFLKGEGSLGLPEATVFETGTNQWRSFDVWPPENLQERKLYFHPGEMLSYKAPETEESYDEFISDPAKPVPYTQDIAIGMTREYMTDDQRFAARRPDVLVYRTEPLTKDLTVAGRLVAHLKVATSESGADWIVKFIDVYPLDHPGYSHNPEKDMGGYQQMVRSEVIRGRFRKSYENPEPFVPGKVTEVDLVLQDVMHTFKKGHRVMVQVQSTWFPLVDRNPQQYVDNIFKADKDDFIKAKHRVYHSVEYPSYLSIGVLEAED